MPDKIIYYAVVDEDTTADRPYGLVRRLEFENAGFADETLRQDFSWQFTPAIVEWKHGDLSYDLIQVSHAQASDIIEYFRRKWGPFGRPLQQ